MSPGQRFNVNQVNVSDGKQQRFMQINEVGDKEHDSEDPDEDGDEY